MTNPFTIRIFVPSGNPEGIKIIDRLSSTSIFLSFPREDWLSIKTRDELKCAGIYILKGYSPENEDLPIIYIGQADTLCNRINDHIINKEFWGHAVVFTSTNKLNSTHAKWIEYALIKKAINIEQCILENSNFPKEPTISESEKADMQVFLNEIYQTLPLVGIRAFENTKTITVSSKKNITNNDKNTIVVPAHEQGFNKVFLKDDCWYAIRISPANLESIKYIAAYQTAPVSAITHIAQVKAIEPYGDAGKYKLIFLEPAKKLDEPITIGDAKAGTMQGPRYTNSEKLKKAKTLPDLF
jgi:hypothetical protein